MLAKKGKGLKVTKMTIRISAIIPTYNRADYLGKAIQSLVDQTLRADQYEILVIDNCSTDRTRQVVCEDFVHVQNLRYIYEPLLGLNQARNTGWQQAHGDYIAYIDDDAIAAPQWLEKIAEAFETVKPTPGFVGGKVEPIWEIERPVWLPADFECLLTILDLSEESIVLGDNQWVVGANMAFSRHVVEKVGGFLFGLDRVGTKLLSNGEVLLEQEIVRRGYTGYYDPAIAVKHLVPTTRLTQSWFIRRLYWQGVSGALIEVHNGALSWYQRLRTALYRIRRFINTPHKLKYVVITTSDATQFAIKCRLYGSMGEIAGLLGISR